MWISIALIVSALITAVATRSTVVEMETCATEFNKDIIQNMTVALISVGNRKVINGSIKSQIGLTSFDLIISHAMPQGKARMVKLFNLTLNGCEFLAQPLKNPTTFTAFILNNIRNSIKNLPKRCPIKKFTEVSISNLFVDTEQMPFPIIQSRFEFTVTLAVQSTLAFRVRVDGDLKQVRKRVG